MKQLILSFVVLFVILSLGCARKMRGRGSVFVKNTCDGIPSVPHDGPGCGIPDYIDPEILGDNNFSQGVLRMRLIRGGLILSFRLFELPKPDLVLTAWLMWVDPTDPGKPDVFKVGANYVSPCAAYNAGFTSGLGRDPNRFRYTSPTTARLKVKLNFNPTYPNEGALMRKIPCFQKDVGRIQKTKLRQFPVPRTGLFVPSSSAFMRKYDRKSGFEILDEDGFPEIVRSPTRVLSIIIASHIDKTTHGVTPGESMTDHYDLMVFPIDGIAVGQPTVHR